MVKTIHHRPNTRSVRFGILSRVKRRRHGGERNMLKVWVFQVYMHGRTTSYYGHTTTPMTPSTPPPIIYFPPLLHPMPSTSLMMPLSLPFPLYSLSHPPPRRLLIGIQVSVLRVCILSFSLSPDLSFIRLDSAVAGFRCVICSLPISYYHHLVYINRVTYIWVSPV